MNTVDVFRGAKEILADERRWSSNGWCKDDGTLCVVEALTKAAGDYAGARDAHLMLMKALGGSAMGFNDDPNTTHADVMDALDRVILSLAGEGIASESRPHGVPRAKDSHFASDAPSPAGVVA